MQILQRLTFRNGMRNAIIVLLYSLFLFYGLYQIQITTEVAGKVCYGILTILVLSISLWAEYLRYLYHKAIKELNMNCNPDIAKSIFNDLQKKDFFKSYRKTVIIFDTLCALDKNDPQGCLLILDQSEKFFRSSLDNLLIRNFSSFYAYFLLENRTKTKSLYQDVIKLKGAKVKGNKISPLYNWEFIDAIYYFASKDYKKSAQAFERCNTVNMNQRELVQFYYQYAKLADKMQLPALRDLNYEKVASLEGSNSFILMAKHIRGNQNENE